VPPCRIARGLQNPEFIEGFRADPAKFTRPWFSWANSLFCELMPDVCGM